MLDVFLDDTRQPVDAYVETGREIYMKNPWNLVKNFDEFCNHVVKVFNEYNSLPAIFSFDHNLAPEHYQSSFGNIPYESYKEKTGWHCALWLKNFCDNNELDYPKILSHSASPQGRENILAVFYDL